MELFFDIEAVYLCKTELFEIKLFLYLTVCEQKNCIVMQNWIAWYRTVFDIQTAYLYQNELFEIERFWYLNCVLMLNWIVWYFSPFRLV